MITQRDTSELEVQYWSIVQQCLQRIYGLEPMQALGRIQEKRLAIEKRDGWELIYHEEPFSLAYDLANKCRERSRSYNKVLKEHKGTYHGILVMHGWAKARNEGNSTHRRSEPSTHG